MIKVLMLVFFAGMASMAFAMKHSENMGTCKFCGSPTTMERMVCLGCDMVERGHQDEGVCRRKF